MASIAAEIHGVCEPRFAAVREAFEANFRAGLEVGASVAVTIDGAPVVDLWGGHADAARSRPWERDSIVRVYSSTKGWLATCAHMLVDRGLIELDAPVARYWPEFAQARKERITVAQLLDHSSGVAAIGTPITEQAVLDWETMVHALEAQPPWWEPGTDHGYHAITFGWLVGEVIRRVTSMTPGAFLRTEVAGPLGLELHIGFGPELDGRVADIVPPRDDPAGVVGGAMAGTDRTSLDWNVWMNPPRSYQGANSRASRLAEIPASNGHANARAVARLYGALARGGELDGVRLLSAEALQRATEERRATPDRVTKRPARRGLGYQLWNDANGPDPRSRRAFGHPGAGGSNGFADPEHRLGFGYTMNQIGGAVDNRSAALIEALYGCL